jgi:hypothetical protein
MKKNFKTLAGMAVCILGALAASSCSKDEFFGLEDSEVLDYSAKYEIAMSQAYADYALASYNMTETMLQPVDTTEMEIQGEINGKPLYVMNGTCVSALDLLENLKKLYPDLQKADNIDFKEIQEIALANNEALKDIAAKLPRETKTWFSWGNVCSWAESNGHYGASFGDEGWWFSCFTTAWSAVNDAIWATGESYNSDKLGAGLFFGDGTAVSMIGYGEMPWPSVINQGSPLAEADFYIDRNSNIDPWYFGGEFTEGNRLHYVYSSLNNYECFYY